MITKFLTKVTLALIIVAIILFDGISIIVAKIGADDDAQSAAEAAVTAYQDDHSAASVLAAVKKELSGSETLVPNSIKVSSNGTVSLKIRRTADSIVLHLWSTSARWDVVTGYGSASPGS